MNAPQDTKGFVEVYVEAPVAYLGLLDGTMVGRMAYQSDMRDPRDMVVGSLRTQRTVAFHYQLDGLSFSIKPRMGLRYYTDGESVLLSFYHQKYTWRFDPLGVDALEAVAAFELDEEWTVVSRPPRLTDEDRDRRELEEAWKQLPQAPSAEAARSILTGLAPSQADPNGCYPIRFHDGNFASVPHDVALDLVSRGTAVLV